MHVCFTFNVGISCLELKNRRKGALPIRIIRRRIIGSQWSPVLKQQPLPSFEVVGDPRCGV